MKRKGLGKRIKMKPEQFNQAILEFKELYKQEYDIDLTNQEASEKASSLLQLFGVLTSNKKGGNNEII